MKWLLCRKCKLILCLLFIPAITFSQWTYSVDYYEDSGNPGNLNIEGDAPGGSSWSSIAGPSDPANMWTDIYTLPFPFEFFGTSVTHFKASLNGVLTFDTTAVLLPPENGNLPSADLPDLSICAFWDSFTNLPPTGNNDEIKIAEFGTAPYRQFWIKWYSMETGNPASSYVYFSIVLEETSNIIYIVDQYSAGNPPLESTIGIQQNTGFAVQFGLDNISDNGNGVSHEDNDVYVFSPFYMIPDDAGINVLIDPLPPLVPGYHNVVAEFKNYGINTLSSVDIQWEVNSVPHQVFQWTGSLGPGDISPQIILGTADFPQGMSSLKIWTEMPNSTADYNNSNDTLYREFCSALDGNYTIGGTSPDFPGFNEAAVALANCGVSGNVYFDVRPGVYHENIRIPEIPGASETCTITFDGHHAYLVTLYHDATVQPAVVQILGGDYVTFRNITFENTGITNAWGVHLRNRSDHITIDSCSFYMNLYAVANTIAIIASNNETDDFSEGNTTNYSCFSNNFISGGDMGIHIEGNGDNPPDWIRNISILNNTFSHNVDFGIYVDNIDSLIISGNSVSEIESQAGDAINCYDIMNFHISGNTIHAPDYGIFVSDGNFDWSPVNRASVVNNMIISDSDYALYLDDINDIDIFHNSLKGDPAIRINDFSGLDIRNNIFYSEHSYAFQSDDTIAGQVIDYNLYFTPEGNNRFVQASTGLIYSNLANWKLSMPVLNSSSVENDPLFKDEADLHVQGFYANDIGDNSVNISLDIDGDVRPMAPSSTVDIGADEFVPLTRDAVFFSFYEPTNYVCGNSSMPVIVIIYNLGDTIFSMPVAVNITGDINQSFVYQYDDTLLFDQYDTVTVGYINAYEGGHLVFSGFTSLPGEENPLNDMIIDHSITIIPVEPHGSNALVCEADTAILHATPYYPVFYEWYNSPFGGVLVGIGNELYVPSIAAEDTFFLQYAGLLDSITTRFDAGNGCAGGAMFNISSFAGSKITGFGVNSSAQPGTGFMVNVYYIPYGSYTGNQYNPGAWTFQHSYVVTATGYGNNSKFLLDQPLTIPAGATYGIYLQYDAEYTNGFEVFSNDDIQISCGAGLCGAFSGVTSNRIFNGTVYYTVESCSTTRTMLYAASGTHPEIDLGNDTVICNDLFVLEADVPGLLYLWSDGDTSSVKVIDSTGTYFLYASNIYGCSDSDTIDVVIDHPMVFLGQDSVICNDDSILLEPAGSWISFLWSTGETGSSIYASAPGSYTVIVTDQFGCTAKDSIATDTIADAVAGFSYMPDNNGIIYFTDESFYADTIFYCFGDSSFSDEPNPWHNYAYSDTFRVCQFAGNECHTDSFCTDIIIHIDGIADHATLYKIKIWPNPSDGNFELSFFARKECEIQLEVLDITGQIIYSDKLTGVPGFHRERINITAISPGYYTLVLSAENDRIPERLMIVR